MRVGLISGSHRKSSQSTKVAKFYDEKLKKKEDLETSLYDLGENPLPIWNPSMWEKQSELKDQWQKFSAGITECEGYILFCPEYAGMASPALKNMFLFFALADLAHKPALIVTISSGMGGSYPNTELRASSFKNTRIVYLPDHVIVRHVESVLNQLEPESKDDEAIRKRIDYSMSVFLEYVKAFRMVRESGVIDLKSFPFGM